MVRAGKISKQGGEGEIRTHGPLTKATVFKTVPLDRSGTSPPYLEIKVFISYPSNPLTLPVLFHYFHFVISGH